MKCIFAGTFDPVTNAHKYVVEQAIKTFGKVVVAVGVNQDKAPLFTVEQRIEMLKCALDGLDVEIVSFYGLIVDFMKKQGITVNVRGLRNQADYEYECKMEYFNKKMYPEIQTYFMPTPAEYTFVSSTAVRSLIEINGDYSLFVPKGVEKLIKKYTKK